MRLLYRKDDGSIGLTRNFGGHEEVPSYAALSHTWLLEHEEVTVEDITHGVAEQKTDGYQKILFCINQAAKDGLQYSWVDTCCIDKRHSEEVGETIRTMFQLYSKATRCYVYLADVSVTEDDLCQPTSLAPWETCVRRSRWFTRGWTLQELLAPDLVEFYSREGIRLGDKHSLEDAIHEVTGISRKALQGESLHHFSTIERLSWATKRQTTRKEDKAYSLFGIFGVFLPVLYGEGEHALTRLREAIDRNDKVNAEQDHVLDTLPTTVSAAFNSFDNQYAPTCLPNTRIELLRDIEGWIDGADHRSIFWLKGIAGTGKSTVARTIARMYYDRGELGGSFFFAKGGEDASHAARMVTTLASQLASNIPSTRRHICEAIAENKGIPQHSLRDQWDQLIIGPLSKLGNDPPLSTVVLVLDALDQCDNERDIRIIIRLLVATEALMNMRLRVLVTSRPETVIRCGFQQIPTTEHRVLVLHEISPALIDRDIRLLFEACFKNMRQERELPPEWPGERAVARLVESSGALFIWASVACRYIREGKQLATQRISKLISGYRSDAGPETQLDQIYLAVLRESIQQGYDPDEKEELYRRLREVLGNIITLFSALPMASLANLIDVRIKWVADTLEDLHTILRIPTQSDHPIRLHHPTFREFLLNKARCSDMNFWVDGTEAHRAVADSCIRLMSQQLKQNICGLKSPGIAVRSLSRESVQQCISPELRYACLYWVEHYRRSEIHLRDDDVVHQFFQKHFLHWVEAMTLLRKSSVMAGMIRMYHSLLTPGYNTKQSRFVADARRLLYSFQTKIEETPLQVYCAALAFIRPSNQLRRHFWSQIHPWIKHIHVAQVIASEAKDEYNYVNELAFTRDGRRVASGSIGPRVRIWDVGTKATVDKFEGQAKKVSSISISPNDEALAAGSDDTTVMVWEMKSKAVRYVLTGHTRWVNSLAFSPNGKLLASGSMDETIRIWDAQSGNEHKLLRANSSPINSISFSPDSSLIASGTVDQTVLLWDVDKGAIRTMFDGHSGPVNSVRVSPNGKHIVSGSDDMTVRLWSVDSGTEITAFKGHSKKVCAVTISHDSCIAVSGSEDRSVKLWDIENMTLINTLIGHTSGINAVSCSRDGSVLASGSYDDEVRLWDMKTGASYGKLADFRGDEPGSPSIKHLPASPVYSASEGGISNSATIRPLIISPDGQIVASTSTDNAIQLWTKQGSKYSDLKGWSSSIDQLSFSADSHFLAAALNNGTIQLWDPVHGILLHTLDCKLSSGALLQFSSDGTVLASYSATQTIKLWNTASGTLVNRLDNVPGTINDLVISPDKSCIGIALANGMVCIWDTTPLESEIQVIGAHTASSNSVAFSPDSSSMVSCSSDGTIELWDIAGAVHTTFRGHTLPAYSVAVSHDTKRIVSCSEDMTVRIWNVEQKSTEEIIYLDVIVHSVAFSCCDQYIVTDRGVLRFDPAPALSRDFASNRNRTVFVSQDWVKCDGEDAMWLPDDYNVAGVAVCNETAVLAHTSGAISFIGF